MRLLAVSMVLVIVGFAAGPTRAEITPEARRYLEDALHELQTRHVNRGKVDWTAVRESAFAAAKEARTPRDTYPAIRLVIEALGEPHTVLREPRPPAASAPAGTPTPAAPQGQPALPRPEGRRVDGRYGYVSIPGWGGRRDLDLTERFVGQIRAVLAEHDAAGVCGWIVDLRGNNGGNVWPMFDGLGPLLGEPPFTASVVDGVRSPSLYVNGRAYYEGMPDVPPALPELRLRAASAPVAVLIGPKTASSGEQVGIAFRGLPNARFFGEPTADRVSVNNPARLSDGAVITTTVGHSEDRTGRPWTRGLTPDEVAVGEAALDAARAWLDRQACTPTQAG